MTFVFLCALMALFFGVFASKVVVAQKAKALEADARDNMLMLTAGEAAGKSPRAIDMFNKYVTMARARAVRVQDEHLTVIYARENKTKGRVKFDMDTAFDDVHEGDVGVLVIIEPEIVGRKPFYKFIRDAEIPTIHDVIELGTGDDLTDRIYAAALESGVGKRKQLTDGSDGAKEESDHYLGMELPRAKGLQRTASRGR